MSLDSLAYAFCTKQQEPKNEYSHLDPKRAAQEEEEEEEEDLYPDLGDLESNDLIQFAYQIASGMVCLYVNMGAICIVVGCSKYGG